MAKGCDNVAWLQDVGGAGAAGAGAGAVQVRAH